MFALLQDQGRREVQAVCAAVLGALQALHAARYVHSNGNVKLTDFGCAKRLENGADYLSD